MDFKRFNGSTWETVRHKIYGSGTDSLTAFPAMIQASGEPLTDYLISGNTIQDGTPTPEAPVDVVGCGVRTSQLFNYTQTAGTTDGKYINRNAGISENQYYYISYPIYLTVGESYTWRYNSDQNPATHTAPTVGFYDENDNLISVATHDNGVKYFTFTVPVGCKYIRASVYKRDGIASQAMLNLGSTALPYEPYGYKLPITVTGTEHPIYLGQVETTRRIKKYEFTGTEALQTSGSGNTRFFYMSIAGARSWTTVISDRYVYANIASTTEVIGVAMSGNSQIRIRPDLTSTVNDFKSYLAAQYANGNPVTVWYVLAEPETGIVNEPLHKIDDNADTITMAQAGIAIPTSDGDNTITFGTTVQPSGMSATFRGWHPVQAAKQYDGNDWR